MQNPLLEFTGLPPFSQIQPNDIPPAIDQLLLDSNTDITELLNSNDDYSWDNFGQPMENIRDRINKIWSPVSHMNAVVNSEALRHAYNTCLTKMTHFNTELSQNPRVFTAYQRIADHDSFAQLTLAQQKVIDDTLRDFHLSGIDLPAQQQQRFKDIKQQLSKLTSKFSDNVLDATQAWKKQVTDQLELTGLPASAIAMAKQTAQQNDKEGWLFTLEFPSYYAVITYADNRSLRKEIHDAYVTRASEQGPYAGKWDNSTLMEEIVALRHELASLLGFNNYAEYSLATKMAASPNKVLDFLYDLAERSKDMAQKELDTVTDYARQTLHINDLQPWDIPYVSEKLRQHLYAISPEELKPYFPEHQVITGLFAVVKQLYGLSIQECTDIDTWHPDVRFFEISDREGNLRGQFFTDLYARPHKKGGAWMGECICRKKDANTIQIPVAYLNCNFSPPIGDEPALFTHNEVITLFHEFGHGLHHLLTQIDYPSVSGINGVPWDAVELPSQFMENWCWEKQSIDLTAKHYQSHTPLPHDTFKKMINAKNFQAGMQMLRQLEFALFDFKLHLEYPLNAGKTSIQYLLDNVRHEVAVVKPADYNRFQHSFSHIFAGGYAAGYYSYKWAEVLSADAFEKFKETGIFNQETGLQFLQAILEQGGARDPMTLFIAFRGREPSINALLRDSGLAA
ncbi:MAG: oligopeptidase A [Gammaproteobacteria bacterium]|nr:oligopeptidase A [Gammaproteobacteria bacterium]